MAHTPEFHALRALRAFVVQKNATMSTPFHIEERSYPNGQTFLRILHGIRHLGNIDQSKEGFTPFNHRKPMPTIPLAIRKLVASNLKAARKLVHDLTEIERQARRFAKQPIENR